LPDLRALLDESTAFEPLPALREQAGFWMTWGPLERARLEAEARAITEAPLDPRALAAATRTLASGAAAGGPTLAGEAWRRRRGVRDDDRIVDALVQIVRRGGPSYVKLGQLISTSAGFLPDAWVDAFAWCRDRVPALPTTEVRRIVEDRFGVPVDVLFATFDAEPLGAASIAQAHAATLPDGTPVVVKIRRPGIEVGFRRDLRTLAVLAAAAERLSEAARIARLRDFVTLFGSLVLQELDFRLEALNQVELGLVVEHSGETNVTVPVPIGHLVTPDVLVMTRLPGVPYNKLTDQDPDLVSAEALLDLAIITVVEQMMMYGRFHGDLHAGNVLVDDQGRFGFVDFGIVGRFDPDQRGAIVRFLFAFARNDLYKMVTALQELGAVADDVDPRVLTDELETELRAAFPAFLDRTEKLTVDGLGAAVGAIVKVLARNDFRLPTELILFFKNLLYLNGFAATLTPDVNMFDQIPRALRYFVEHHQAELTQVLWRGPTPSAPAP
jgi:ubiquinone biosynthesis protein